MLIAASRRKTSIAAKSETRSSSGMRGAPPRGTGSTRRNPGAEMTALRLRQSALKEKHDQVRCLVPSPPSAFPPARPQPRVPVRRSYRRSGDGGRAHLPPQGGPLSGRAGAPRPCAALPPSRRAPALGPPLPEARLPPARAAGATPRRPRGARRVYASRAEPRSGARAASTREAGARPRPLPPARPGECESLPPARRLRGRPFTPSRAPPA